MSDARWLEVETAILSATQHFDGAINIFARLATAPSDDRYVFEMGFMHAMMAGHTSLENALLRILAMWDEEPPSGAQWHSDLVRRAARAVGTRPAVLDGELFAAADETRRFRNVANRGYDDFDEAKSALAVAAAVVLRRELAPAITRFREAIDP